MPGAGGTIGLGQFVQTPGREDALLVTGGVMVGAIELGDNPESMADVVPIARLADDYAAFVVPADSRFKTLDDFIEAWKADPGATSIGGGSLGSIDHLLSGLVAKTVGIDPQDVNYIAYSGGGEALTSLLSHTTAAGMSGYNEVSDQIEAGTLRALAISSHERLDGMDVPTFSEQGVDVAMSNWRGVVAAPGITRRGEAEFIDIVTEMRGSAHWQDTLDRNNWTDTFSTGDEFEQFIDQRSRNGPRNRRGPRTMSLTQHQPDAGSATEPHGSRSAALDRPQRIRRRRPALRSWPSSSPSAPSP